MQTQSSVKIIGLPDSAVKRGSIFREMSHSFQGNNNSSQLKSTSVSRYQREYNVEYNNPNGKIELVSIDGNKDLDETYTEDFLKHITNKIDDLESTSKDNDEEYDEWFQNRE